MGNKHETYNRMSSVVEILLTSFLVLILLNFSIRFLIKRLFTTTTSNKNPPPSPPKLPIIGHLHQLGSHPHRSLLSLARRHGPIMLLRFGNRQIVVISSTDAACEIMKTHDLVFASRPDIKISRKLLYDRKDVSVAPYGEYWRQLKSICVLQLLSNKRVQSFRTVREEETALMMTRIKKEPCSSSTPLNLSEMFVSIAYDVVCRSAFGIKCGEGESGKKFRQLLMDFMGLVGVANVEDFLPWVAWINRLNGRNALAERVAKGIDEFLEGVVEDRMDRLERESNGAAKIDDGERREDFVDILLTIYKDDKAAAFIDRDSIKALILDIFAAGTDTTSTVLEWAMTELLRHPEVMKDLQKEVRGIAQDKPDVTEDDLEKMHYLKAVMKETLRFHTPIPLLVPREARQEVKVMGYDIAAGTMVIINAWAIGRDSEAWDAPEEFRPERFLNSSIDFKGHDFQLIPFGAGRRGCPGISFAMAINELVLANLVHKFDWELPEGAKVEDLDMTECSGLTASRKVPLLAVANPWSF